MLKEIFAVEDLLPPLMLSFGRKKPALLGIDISSTSVKLIELSQAIGISGALFRVEHHAVEPLPSNAVIEKKIADIQAVGDSIRKAVLRSDTKSRTVAVAVSGSTVITKVISMPSNLTDAEMETQIQLDADQYIPYPLEEVNIDFDVLGPSATGTEVVDVLLAASRRENVDDRLAALEIAGLTADIVDVEAYAMENACALLLGDRDEDLADKTEAIVDIGATTMTLQVLHNGRTTYTREQNFGGLQLLEEVQRRYAMPRDEALRKVIDGGLPASYGTDVLAPFKEALAQQIGRALQFFYSAGRFSRIDQIIMAGGAAGIPAVEDLMEERLGVSTVVANPFTHMAMSPSVRKRELRRDAPAMMIAVGLALRSFD